MPSPLDVLISGSQLTNINKSGNLQAGQAVAQQISQPELDTAADTRVKALPKVAETLASFRGPVLAEPATIQSASQLDEKKVTANLKALQAFASGGSLSDAASSISISV